jgi:hypothetical protein
VWPPTLRLELLKAACPLPSNAVGPDNTVPGSAHVPASMNVTLPALGFPAPAPVPTTVAVNVTDWPNTDGDGAAASDVEVDRGFTVCETAGLVLAPNCGDPVVVPLYAAVMLWGLPATLRVDVVQVAMLPALRATAEQSVFTPSLKVTVPTPLGAPPVALTVAVNVREPPNALGLVPLVRARAVVVGRTAAAFTVTVGAGDVLVSVPPFCFVWVVKV